MMERLSVITGLAVLKFLKEQGFVPSIHWKLWAWSRKREAGLLLPARAAAQFAEHWANRN